MSRTASRLLGRKRQEHTLRQTSHIFIRQGTNPHSFHCISAGPPLASFLPLLHLTMSESAALEPGKLEPRDAQAILDVAKTEANKGSVVHVFDPDASPQEKAAAAGKAKDGLLSKSNGGQGMSSSGFCSSLALIVSLSLQNSVSIPDMAHHHLPSLSLMSISNIVTRLKTSPAWRRSRRRRLRPPWHPKCLVNYLRSPCDQFLIGMSWDGVRPLASIMLLLTSSKRLRIYWGPF